MYDIYRLCANASLSCGCRRCCRRARSIVLGLIESVIWLRVESKIVARSHYIISDNLPVPHTLPRTLRLKVKMGDSSSNLGYRFYPNALCHEVCTSPTVTRVTNGTTVSTGAPENTLSDMWPLYFVPNCFGCSMYLRFGPWVSSSFLWYYSAPSCII